MSATPDDRAQIAALLDASQQAIDAARVMLASGSGASAAVLPAPSVEPEWVNLATAAFYLGKHPDTASRIVRAHGLGRRVGRDWSIDLVRVRAWQQGQPFPPLAARTSDILGDRRESSEVSRGARA